MKWVAPRGIRVHRAATAWLVRRFVDESAEFLFVDADRVADVQTREGATGFDAPGATYPPLDGRGRTAFEALAAKYCFSDPALREMGRIVASAEFESRVGETAEGAGLRAVCRGIPLVASDDHDAVARSAFLFDALYASIAAGLHAAPE